MWWIRLSSTALPTTLDPMTRMVHGDKADPCRGLYKEDMRGCLWEDQTSPTSGPTTTQHDHSRQAHNL